MSKEIIATGLRQGQITLEGTAEAVNRLCGEAMKLSKASILKAKEAGELLAAARNNIKHGAFEAWVDNKIDIGLTHARTCIKIHEHWDELCETYGPGNLAMLSISRAAKAIKQKKKLGSPKVPPPPTSKAHSTADFPPVGEAVDDDVQCSKGGLHEWEEDADGVFCRHCHVERPAEPAADDADAEDDPGSEGEESPGEAAESLAVGRLRSLERKIEKLYAELTNSLAEYEKLKPNYSRADAKQSLDLSYLDWKSHKRK